jgi:glycerol-3-phosphate dehydrogenase (NAD(P)+)
MDLREALTSDIVVISVNCQGFRTLCREIAVCRHSPHTLLLAMKGLELRTGRRMSEIAGEELENHPSVAILVGPGHVQSLTREIPTAMIIDSESPRLTDRLAGLFSSSLIHIYKGEDFIGNEIGAALKNVVGIAAGMLDGIGYQSLKGPLMSRAAKEASRFILVAGGKAMSAYGLAHLGDYEATLFSPFSHNRRYGESFIRGELSSAMGLAEGVETLKAVIGFSRGKKLDMPICETLYDILFQGASPREGLLRLLERPLKAENLDLEHYIGR